MGKHLPRQVRSALRASLTPLRKPQQPQALLYLAGLLWIIRFRSLREIASRYGGSLDRLQHFVSCSTPCARLLQHQGQQHLARLAPDQTATLLVLDDTPIARNGQAIEGLGCHHTPKGLVRGWCAVTAMLKVGTQRSCGRCAVTGPRRIVRPASFRARSSWPFRSCAKQRLVFPTAA